MRCFLVCCLVWGGLLLGGCPSAPNLKQQSVGGLIRLLRAPQPGTRRAAALRLKELGPEAQKAMRPLRHAMIYDRNAGVREAAIRALLAIGSPAISLWSLGLVSKDARVKSIATQALGRLDSSDAKAIATLLASPLAAVRDKASQKLAGFGNGATAAVPVLGRLLKHTEVDVRIAAAETLRKLGPISVGAVQELHDALRGNKSWWRVRVSAAHALGNIGPQASGAAGTLAELLENRDGDIGQAARKALMKMGPATVPVLGATMKDASWRVQLQIAKIFARLGPKAAAGIPALGRTIEDSDTEVKRACIEALGKIGPKAASMTPILRRILHNQQEEATTWRMTLLTLLRLGPKGLKVLGDALESKQQWWLPTKVSSTLASLGKKIPTSSIPLLTRALGNHKWEVRWTSTMLIQKLGAKASGTVPALKKALLDTEARVKRGAAKALASIGPAAKPAIPTLRSLLQDKDEKVREAAQKALAKLGVKVQAPPPSR